MGTAGWRRNRGSSQHWRRVGHGCPDGRACPVCTGSKQGRSFRLSSALWRRVINSVHWSTFSLPEFCFTQPLVFLVELRCGSPLLSAVGPLDSPTSLPPPKRGISTRRASMRCSLGACACGLLLLVGFGLFCLFCSCWVFAYSYCTASPRWIGLRDSPSLPWPPRRVPLLLVCA